MNNAILIGRLGADPEIRYLQDGTMITNFRIATDESYKSKTGEKTQKPNGIRSSPSKSSPRSAGVIWSRGSWS